MSNQLWLIWSPEHNRWRNPYRQGYTLYRSKAGRYKWDEALELVWLANIRCGNRPNEALVPE